MGLRGSRLQAGRKRRAPDEGRAGRAVSAPPLGERGRRLKKPKDEGAEDTGRAQGEEAAAEAPARAAGTEDSSHFSGRAPSVLGAGAESDSVLESGPSRALGQPLPSPLGGRPRACFGGPGGPSAGVAGAGQVEPKDWLKLRTVTLLLEHLNREDGPVVAPSGRTAPKKENRSPPREGKGQGGDPREPPRPPSGGEGSKDSGHGGGGQGGGAGKPFFSKGRRRKTTPTSTTRRTRKRRRRRTTTRWSSRT